MKQPLWETSTGALAALLNSKTALKRFDLYTVTLAGGTVLRWADWDRPVTANGSTWELGPGFKRSRIRCAVGISVDDLNVTIYSAGETVIAGTTLIAYIARGGFENARVQVDRCYRALDSLQPTGALLWFLGRVSETKGDRTQQQLSVKSDTELLDVMVPREIAQPGCLNTVYDSACGADRAAKTVTSTVTVAGDVTRTVFGHSLGQVAGYFDLGVVTFTSGPNAGISRSVRQHTASQLVAIAPFPFDISAGQSFQVYPGCNKSKDDVNGCPKFHSTSQVLRRFRGQPYIPVPETVI